MKSLLKNLGLILMIIGVLGGSAALIVIGLIVYIVLNKRIVD